MIKSRISIRKFKSASIPDDDINEIIEIGCKAPSAGNCQPWRVVVVKDAATREKLAEAAWGQGFVAKAPVILAVCAVPAESKERYGERGETLYVLQDTAALATSLLLGAHFKGYGACWVGAFDEETVTMVLNVPAEMKPVALIPIGISDGPVPKKRERRPLSEILVRECFAKQV
jgi:nitroreductase